MRFRLAAFSLLAMFTLIASAMAGAEADVSTGGRYFGQPLPGSTPVKFEPFGPGGGGGFVFSRDAKRCIFVRDYRLYRTAVVDGKWSTPEKVVLTGHDNEGIFGIGVSHDWERLYFNSLRPIPEGAGEARVPIWIVDIGDGAEWARPEYLGFGGMSVSVAASGSLYFTTWSDGRAQIGRSVYEEGIHKTPELLFPPTGQRYEDMHPSVASDESFVVFDSEDRPRESESTLYISFLKEGEWTEPLHLGGYIEQASAALPKLSLDGEYLFFNDANGDYYWMSTEFATELSR